MIQDAKKTLGTLFVVLLITTTIRAQEPVSILGKWRGVEEPERQIEFVLEKDSTYSGKGINNNSSNSNNRSPLLKNLRYDPNSKTFVGKMTPPDKDIVLDARVSFEGNDKLKVQASMFFITKTIYFLRIK